MPPPFVPVAFDSLPARPRVPHPYFESEAHETVVDSAHFGRHRIHWRSYGSGPPLLLLHGLMTSSYSFRYVLEPLGARYRVIVPDLPGCGRSAAPDVRYTAPALARWIGEMVDALGIRGCDAVGNSMGGYLCMRAVLGDATLFSRLVNVHSPGIPEPRLWALRVLTAVPGVRAGLARFVRRDPRRWAHRNVHYRDETLKSQEEAEEYGKPLGTTEGARAFTRYLAETLDPSDMGDFVRTLERRRHAGQAFPVPLLLLYSRQDPMVPPRVGEALSALLPGAPLVWLEGSSHFAHVDTPQEFLEPVLAFLNEPPRPAAA
jgi:pimeloyl-ACP methyl ester carboxylesterase